MKYVIGIDEVGRGPVAGPLVVVACALKEEVSLTHLFPKGVLRDSKKLSEKQRESIVSFLAEHVANKDLVYGVGEVSAQELDEKGLSFSIREAVSSALSVLEKNGISFGSQVYLDGSLSAPSQYLFQETIIKGDEKIEEIALASVIAKVYRDRYMKEIDKKFPFYGFASHVGYGTKAHYEALKKYGMTTEHRRSFLKKWSGA